MNDLDKKHYTWLKESYNYLIKTIMGADYYTMAIHVFDSDIEAFKDMKNKIDVIKYDLKMWRRIAIVMTIISVMLIIFK